MDSRPIKMNSNPIKMDTGPNKNGFVSHPSLVRTTGTLGSDSSRPKTSASWLYLLAFGSKEKEKEKVNKSKRRSGGCIAEKSRAD